MTEPLDRDDVIALLNTLGSEQDEEVLEAARQVHARIKAAGISWDVLLVPDADPDADAEADPDAEADAPDLPDEPEEVEDDGDDEAVEDLAPDDEDEDEDLAPEDEDVGEDLAPEDEAPKTSVEKDKANRATLALIEALLARADNSEDFRAELEDYKSDIDAGEFAPSDHRYIQALHKRLTGKR